VSRKAGLRSTDLSARAAGGRGFGSGGGADRPLSCLQQKC
jgi:hypothetical protein